MADDRARGADELFPRVELVVFLLEVALVPPVVVGNSFSYWARRC